MLGTISSRGPPRATIRHTPSFVDGIGGRSVLEEMWPLTSSLLADSIVVSLTQVANAVVHMASLPLETNVQFITIMATKMPFVGRG